MQEIFFMNGSYPSFCILVEKKLSAYEFYNDDQIRENCEPFPKG